MATPRAAACSALMADGKVLVAGGDGSEGAVNRVEIYGANGAFAAAAPMAQARSGAACVTMNDGRVFVSGGTAAGSAVASAEIFDPANGEWSAAGSMAAARSGHTATLTPWGAVLLVGGDNDGTAELYRPSINQFLSVGKLSSQRKDYAIAFVPGSRLVVIAGGSSNGHALGTVDIYDGNRDRMIAGGTMASARRNFIAAALADGTVLLAGGYGADGNALASTEIYDPATGRSAAGPEMAEARAEHKGYTLPSNGSVIVMGGTNGRDLLASSEVYTPWTGKFSSTGTLHTARTAPAAALLRKGGLIVAGGKSGNNYLPGGELYSFATVDTDKLDYFPGDVATIVGTGWKAGEEVQIQVTSFPIDQHKVEFTAAAVADGSGRIKIAGFNIDQSHLGARFLLHATGSQSQAENLFTDAGPTSISLNAPNPASPHAFPTGVQYTGNVVDNANTVAAGSLTVTVDNVFVSNATVIAGTGDFDTNTPGPGITNLAPGTHLIGFAYPPTGASGGSSTSALFQVSSVTTTTAINSGPAVLTYGQTTNISGSVVSNGGYNVSPTGQVVCTDGVSPVIATLVAGAPGTSTFSCTTPATLTVNGSPHSYHATYAGFTPNPSSGIPNPTQVWSGSSSGSVNIAINPATVSVVETTSVVSPITFGTPVTLTTTVSVNAPGVGPPAGDVTFLNGGVAIAGCGPIPLVANGQVGTSSCGPVTLPGGTNNLTVHYSPGSTNFGPPAGTDSGTTAFVVNSAATTTAITGSSATGNFGVNETFTATVSSACGAACGAPTGSILFYDITAGPPFAVLNNGVPVTLTPSGNNGVASIILNNIAPGARTIRAFYTHTGTNFTDSNSTGLDFSYTVSKILPNITIQLSPANPTVGQTVTVTASAAPVAGQVPTGQAFILVNATSQGINKFPVAGVWTFTFVADRSTPNPQNIRITTDGSADTYFLSQTGSIANQVTFTVNLAPSTTTVTSTPSTPVPYGATITLSSSTTSTGQGSAIGGTVDYFEGSVGGNLLNAAPVTVTNGAASFIVPQATANTFLTAGTHSIFARYNGDTNYSGANSPAYTLVISPDVTTTVVNTLPAATTTANLGGSVTFGATVTDTSTTNITPTGSITFFDNANNINASCSVAPVLAWVNGVGTASCTVTYTGTAPFTAGAHAITAVYQGTPFAPINVSGSSNNSSPFNLNVTAPTLTIGAPTTNPVATSLATAAIYNNGGTVPTLSIPFTLAGGVTPAPTQSFQIFDGAVQIGTVSLAANPAVFNLPASVYQGVAGSPHVLSAKYPAGDANYASSTSSSVAYYVIKFTPTVSASGFSVNPAFGGSTTLGGTVSTAGVGGGAAAISGSLTFTFGATTLGTCTLVGTSCTITGNHPALTFGADTVTITYNGDANYATATGSGIVNVVQNSVTTVVTTTPSGTANLNTSVVIKATVAAASGTAVPTGSVTFFDNFNGAGPVSIGTSALNASGVALLSTSNLQAGPHVLTAQYLGDTNFAALAAASSTSAALTVSAGTTAVTLLPSATSIALGASSTITYSFTVSGGNASPVGTVLVQDGGVAVPNVVGGGTCIATGPIALTAAAGNTSTGSCTVIYNGQDAAHGVGTHNMTAAYTPTGASVGILSAATSAVQTITVTGSTPTIATPTADAGNPLVWNQTSTISVVVSGLSPAGSPAISGSVNFFDGATLLGSANLGAPNGSNQATATLATRTYTVGSHTITATYTGNASYSNVTSAPLGLTVNKASTNVTMVPFSTSTNFGTGDLLTATVTVLAPTPSGTPTGTVSFRNGGVEFGQGTLNGSGVATFNLTTQLPPGGPYSVNAFYLGDGNDFASNLGSSTVGAASSIFVNKNTLTGALQATPPTAAPQGTAVTFTATFTPATFGVGVPTGTVTFTDSIGGVNLGSGTLNGSGVATLTTSTIVPNSASRTITATYVAGADPNFVNGATATLTYTVSQGTTTVILTPSPTSVPVGIGANSTVTFNYSVTGGPSNTLPQGTVTILNNAVNIQATNTGTCSSVSNAFSGGSGNTATGSCTIIYDGLNDRTSGSHSMTASYSPAGASLNVLAPAVSAVNIVTVGGASTTTAITSTVNPAKTTNTVTFNYTVTGPAGTTLPSGSTVTFSDGVTAMPCDSSTGPAASGNSAIGSCTITYDATTAVRSVGSHSITATFNSGAAAQWANSTSTPLVETVIKLVPKQSPITVTASAAAASNGGYPYGTTFTLAITMIPANPTPAYCAGLGGCGVVFTDLYNGSTIQLGTATITVPSGVASLTNVLLKGGNHHITATFSEDNNFGADPSIVDILINPATLVPGTSISITPGNVPGIVTTYGGVIPQSGQPTPQVTVSAACGLCVLPTGTFTLSVNGTPIASAFTITGATTNVAVNPLPATLLADNPVGSGQVLTVTYSGDANYTLPAGTPLTTTIRVAKANPGTFTLNSSPNPSAVAQNVTFVANVTNPVGQPTGTVAITDLFNGVTSTLTPNALLTTGVANYQTTALTAGTHAITATYNGDNNFNTATVALTNVAAPGNQLVNANAVTVTVTPSTNSTALNTTVTFVVSVVDPPGTNQPAPIGSVLLFDNITGVAQGLPATACVGNGLLTVASPPTNPPSSSVTCTITYDNTTGPVSVHGPGIHLITAQYTPAAGPGGVPPATTWTAAGSATASVSVGAATTNISQPTVTVPAAPPYTYGTNITFTTRVTPGVGGLPASPAFTGFVNFYDNGVPIPGPGCTPAAPNSTTGLFTCTTTTPLTAGNHTITAQFVGDSNYSQSPVSALLVIAVNKFAPTVSTPSPAPTYTTTYAGPLPTLTGSVSNPGAPTSAVPTGQVTLASGATVIATATLDAFGNYTFTTPILPAAIPVGAGQPIGITYSGDTNYGSGTAFSNSSGLTVTKSPVTTTVTSVNVPPASAANPVVGQTVAFTATFTNVAGNAVGGFAAFTVDAGALAACSNVPVTNVGGVNSAVCTVALTTANGLSVGPHSISVISLTDANHTLGTTNPLAFTVNQAGTVTGSGGSTTTIVGNPNPMVSAGLAVTFTATISLVAPGSAPLNGQVTFAYLGTALPCNGVAGPVALNGTTSGSTATCNIAASTAPFNATGSYIISATYHDSTPNSPTADSVGTVTEVVARPAPTVSVTSNSTPVPGLVRTFQSNYGDSVTFTATLTVLAGAPALTGTVQFFDGANALGGTQAVTGSGTTFTSSITVPSAGVATQCNGQPSTVLCGGNHVITASYVPGSDLNYAPATSPSLTQLVNKQNTTTTLSAPVFIPGPTPVYGQEVKITVTVAPNPTSALGNAPTGQIILLDSGGAQIGPVQTLVPTSITPCATPGVNVSCFTFDLIGPTALSVGTHAVTAQYVGDTNYIASASTALNPPLQVLPAPTRTVVNTATFPNPANFGSQITLTATVCALQPGSTTTCSALVYPQGMVGSITFYDGSTKLGVSPAVLGSPAGATGSITVTMETPPFVTVANSSPVGAHNITAVYNDPTSFQISASDGNFASSTSPVVVLTIAKGVTNVTVTTLVTSSANPSVFGQPVTLTAIVTAPSSFGVAPTGTVTFFDGGTQIGIANVALVSAGGTSSTASLTVPSGSIPPFSVGQHVISVTYNGDANYLTSSSPVSGPNTLVQVVKQDPTTTLLSSSTNGSNVGQTITLYAQVSANAPGAGIPTGTVNFLNLASPIQPAFLQCAVGGTAGPAVLVASGNAPNLAIATCTTNNLPQGSLNVSAVYVGDTNFLGSTSNTLTQAVSKTPTNIILTSSLTPSIYGTAVTFNITVTPIIPQLTSATACPGAGCPTGQVQVFDGTSQLATLTLAGGQTQFTTSQLVPGLHAISVIYIGDTNFQPFTTPAIAQQVNKIPTSLALVSNAFTAVASQVVTFTATMSPAPVAGVPYASGQVGFYDGTNLMGVANLQANVATLNVANLAVGLHQISAIYTGDNNWTGATSGFYAETISSATTGTQIISSANPSVFGQSVTFTINVTVPFPGTVPATGQVQLYDNHNALGDPINANNGQFTYTTQSFTPGTHNIIATFINNGSFSTSSSAVLPQVVNKAPTTTTLAVQPNGSTSNQTVTLTAVVSIPTPGAGIPTGAVQFVDSTFSQVLGTAPLQVIGGVYMATLTSNALNQSGSPQILVATYSGDTNFATSTSNPQGQSVFGTQISVVNAAGYSSSNLAADEIVTAFGQNLASTALSATTTPLPTSLAGTSIQVTDSNGTQRLAPLFFVSPNQVNFLIPSNTAFGLATVSITNPQGATASSVILVTRTAPGVFSANASGQGVAAALIQRVHADGTQGPLEQVAVYDSTQKLMVPVPITIGTDTLYLQGYGTGIRYASSLKVVTCTINGANAPVLYAGAAPGFVGLDQFNVQIPAGLAGAGTVNVILVVDGEAANTVTLTFK